MAVRARGVALRLAAALAAGWLGLSGWAPAAGWVATRLGPVDLAQTGELVRAVGGALVVARRERLLAAPGPGRVEPLAAEGQAVPAGYPVATVYPEAGPPMVVRSPAPGVVSYYADGLESWQGPEMAFSAADPSTGSSRARPLLDGRPVGAGQPLARLVDRSALWAVFWPRPADAEQALRAGTAVELVLPDEPVGLRATVLEVRGEGAARRLLLAVHRQPAEWLYRRVVPGARLVVRRFRGVVVAASSLARRGQREGVFVRTAGGASWVPVEVLARAEGLAAVRGVPAGSEVYRWPRWLRRY